jgi:AcrR family transcriptional regulator
LIALVVERGPADLSIRDLADRAGVVERTVYRHFPDRPALLDGLADHVGERTGWEDLVRQPVDLANLPTLASATFARYDEHADAVRALTLLNADPARPAAISAAHTQVIRQAVKEAYPHLDHDTAVETAAVLHVLVSSRTWMRHRFEEGLTPSQAQRATARATRAVLADLEPRDRGFPTSC